MTRERERERYGRERWKIEMIREREGLRVARIFGAGVT